MRKILLEGRVVFAKKPTKPKRRMDEWYGAAVFSVKCFPWSIVRIFIG
jgi:hypothetical protein